jgi:hypothetical protein
MAQNADEFGTGWQRWNLQAWLDWVLVKIMMKRVGDVIPKTYVPILRLVAEDAGKVDDDYRMVLSLREPIRLFDSPRERWRKTYGAYVRELEWVYRQLQRHFPTEEYQELVIDIIARTMRDWLRAFMPSMEQQMTRKGAAAADDDAAIGKPPGRVARAAAKGVEKAVNGWLGRWLMNNLNPASFIVGPAEVKMLPEGEIEIYIPRCWMHTAPGDGRTQDEACVQGCKGGCERLFGPDAAMTMLFEPHLPEYSCTIRAKPGGGALQQA